MRALKVADYLFKGFTTAYTQKQPAHTQGSHTFTPDQSVIPESLNVHTRVEAVYIFKRNRHLSRGENTVHEKGLQ